MLSERLTNEGIDRACEAAAQFLAGHRCDSKEVLRIKFGIEEVLMAYQKLFGTEGEFLLETSYRFRKCRLRLTVPGTPADPYAGTGTTTEEDVFIHNALSQMGKLPRWRYRNGKNAVLFVTNRRKKPEWMKLITAVTAAVVCGFAIRLMPADFGNLVRDGIIAPLINTFLGYLNAVAGPMVFLSVVWGIYSIGDATTFSEVGKRLSQMAGLFLLVTSSAVSLLSLPLFRLEYSGTQAGGDFSSLYRMVLDIVPSNLFTPFSRGNTLQILFVAVTVGVTMLLISKNTQAVADLAEQLSFIVNSIMGVISSLVPMFVFGSLFMIVATSDFDKLAAGGKFFLASVAGCALMMILHMAATCIRCGYTPVALWKNTFSTFIIAITTASTSAAFSDNLDTCTNKLGIDRKLANFGVPFCQILYKPAAAVLFWFAAVCTAESEQIEVSLTWIITALFMCIVLSSAAPPVPGGMSASFTILFTQLGLPETSIGVILSLTSILDFLVTATIIFSGQCLLKVTSHGLSVKKGASE